MVPRLFYVDKLMQQCEKNCCIFELHLIYILYTCWLIAEGCYAERDFDIFSQ